MTDQIIGVYGASGFGREVLPLLREQLLHQGSVARAKQLVFIDDDDSTPAAVNGHRVLNWESFCVESGARGSVVLAVADSKVREKLARKCERVGVEMMSVKAPNICILDSVNIGLGSILASFVTLTSNIRIGRYFHANVYSYVGHDCIIGDFVTFAPAVKCNGNVRIEDYAYIGAGAIIKQGASEKPLVIGRGAVVGMGAVVTKSVPPGVTVVGNPARILRRD